MNGKRIIRSRRKLAGATRPGRSETAHRAEPYGTTVPAAILEKRHTEASA
jgi:hypothetical protein